MVSDSEPATKGRSRKSEGTYRIADLSLAFAEGLVDADDVPLPDDVEGFAGGSRVHWRLCGGSLGGAPGRGGGGGEEARGQLWEWRRRWPGRPESPEEGVVPPPRRSGNQKPTVERRATPNHH